MKADEPGNVTLSRRSAHPGALPPPPSPLTVDLAEESAPGDKVLEAPQQPFATEEKLDNEEASADEPLPLPPPLLNVEEKHDNEQAPGDEKRVSPRSPDSALDPLPLPLPPLAPVANDLASAPKPDNELLQTPAPPSVPVDGEVEIADVQTIEPEQNLSKDEVDWDNDEGGDNGGAGDQIDSTNHIPGAPGEHTEIENDDAISQEGDGHPIDSSSMSSAAVSDSEMGDL